MSRNINGDELLRKLPDDLPYKASVKRVLMQAPTADVVEVVHARWNEDGRCSNCGWYMPFNCLGEADESEYCSVCGAKMDGERRENEG